MLKMFLTISLLGEQAKNDHAMSIMKRILDQAAWINIHMLPVSYHNYILCVYLKLLLKMYNILSWASSTCILLQ